MVLSPISSRLWQRRGLVFSILLVFAFFTAAYYFEGEHQEVRGNDAKSRQCTRVTRHASPPLLSFSLPHWFSAFLRIVARDYLWSILHSVERGEGDLSVKKGFRVQSLVVKALCCERNGTSQACASVRGALPPCYAQTSCPSHPLSVLLHMTDNVQSITRNRGAYTKPAIVISPSSVQHSAVSTTWLFLFLPPPPSVCAVLGEEVPVVCLLGRPGHSVISRPGNRPSHLSALPGKSTAPQIPALPPSFHDLSLAFQKRSVPNVYCQTHCYMYAQVLGNTL